MQMTPNCFLFILPTQLRFMHHQPSECPSANLFLDDCQSSILSTPLRLNSYSLDSESNMTRYTTPHLTPLTLLATLDSFLMNILPSLIKFRPSPKLDIAISDSFVVSVLTLIPTQIAPLPPPSFTPNSITVILSTPVLLSKSQITHLQQSQNSLARVVVKTPKCCHITPIIHSLHWLKITERIEYKLLSGYH